MNIYPDNALNKLDFPFIKRELENLCSGSLGKKELHGQAFIANTDELAHYLQLVNECKNCLQHDAALPQYGYNELNFLNKLNIINYYFQIEECIELYYFLSGFTEWLRFFTPKARQQLYPALYQKINDYSIEIGLIHQITSVIDIEQKQVKENATPELMRIRKSMYEKNHEINAAFRRALNHYRQQQYLIETEETVREGRRVLAVRAEYKRSIKGVILDESENGNITYIEPNETLFLNNELTELRLEEKREIIKILTALTLKIQPYKEQIDQLQTLMGELDVIKAKAYFAINYDCHLPELSKEKKIYLIDFVHPVLYYHLKKNKKEVVANTFYLDDHKRVLVLSGPNAGGKSIVLKSIGLIQLMLQFGMLIPAKEGSVLSCFEKLFVDIGDEQSIENDLSTYSSHLSNMNYFIRHANAATLLLVDEMGMGTDPALGGPMAETILDNLYKKKVFAVITTHFHNLKIYAQQTDGIQSGAMSFDKQHLKPAYQLQLGQPGSSFTFEIAKKVGLPDKLIQDATGKTGENKKVLDEVLTDIQTEKQFIKGIRKNVQQKESHLSELTQNYEKMNKELSKDKKRLLKYYEQRLLEKFNEESRNLENEMRKWREEKSDKNKFLEVRKYIDENREDIEERLNETEHQATEHKTEFTIGQKVVIDEGLEVGQILDIKNNQITVGFGSIQTKVKKDRIKPAEPVKTQTAKKQSVNTQMITEKSQFDYHIDLRGLLKEEALPALENFLDRGLMYGFSKMKILHGRGTGALRQAVHHYLKQYKPVKSFYFEEDKFGGDAITIVEMK